MTTRLAAALANVGAALGELATALQDVTVPEPRKRLTLTEASEQTGVAVSTLSDLCRRGLLTCTRVGAGRGRYLVLIEDVEACLRRRETTARAPVFRETTPTP